MLADHCDLYNAALQERRSAYAHPSRTKIRYGDQSAQLKEIRGFDLKGQGRWSFSSQQATLRRSNRAFEAFLRRVKASEKPGYPRFRSRSRFDTVEFPRDGDGCKWDSTPHDRITRVRLQGVGHVRVHQHRPVRGRVKTISVKREGRRWFLGILAHKAECAGRELIPVDPFNTSRTCPSCGHVASENRDGEIFECTACGHTDHADRVAALNIATRAGLVLHAVA